MNEITVPRPFGAKLRDLLLDKEVTTPMGNPDWAGFAQQLPGIHYETLRKAVVGDRQPAPKVIKAVSDALGVPPHTFTEYRLWRISRCFDPQEIGFEQAVHNLEACESMLAELEDDPTGSLLRRDGF